METKEKNIIINRTMLLNSIEISAHFCSNFFKNELNNFFKSEFSKLFLKRIRIKNDYFRDYVILLPTFQRASLDLVSWGSEAEEQKNKLLENVSISYCEDIFFIYMLYF